ncbi:MAG: aspartate-semialdehyde dehydrogenase, partial [Candidatus Dormibacteraeota bacterium]|nr:aspartate-semialdehyde dehydrogenase [Candidatus Dormibacteraeota bacterium]
FLETEEPLTPAQVRDLLAGAPGVVIQDDPAGQGYPTPAAVAGTDDVYVGRVRRDLSHENGLALWVVADNLRKGAALNAVQVAERAIQEGVL